MNLIERFLKGRKVLNIDIDQALNSIVHTRKLDNTSKTAKESLKLEDDMHRVVLQRLAYRERKGANNTWNYAIPYLIDKEITLTGTEKHNGMKVPTNALDSIAKYAGITKTPIKIAIGLPFQETSKGNHFYYNMLKIRETDSKKTLERKRVFNRNLGNAEYFRNYGIIPAEVFVNDHEYTDGGYNKGNPITNIPPLLHAFEYFKSGRYNPGDSKHTKDVINSGNDVWSSPEIENWWKTSGKKFYYNK